jgi:hypothetical protein
MILCSARLPCLESTLFGLHIIWQELIFFSRTEANKAEVPIHVVLRLMVAMKKKVGRQSTRQDDN